MRWSTPLSPFEEFVGAWRHWLGIVERFARRRLSRHRLTDEDYAGLHAALMAACSQFSASGDQQQREFAAKVKQIVKPWVALDALKNENRHTLFALLARCADVERGFVARKSRLDPTGWSTGTLVSAALIAAAGLALVWAGSQGEVMDSLSGGMRGTFINLTNQIRWSSFVERFSVIAVIAVLIGIRLALRTARSG